MLTSQARCVPWSNYGIAIMEITAFWLNLRPVPQEGFCAWNYNPGQKLMTGPVIGPRVEAAVVTLLNSHAKNHLLNTCAYTHRSEPGRRIIFLNQVTINAKTHHWFRC